MARKYTRTDAFAHFDAALVNSRWSWSARSADQKTVVLALWQHALKKEGDRWVYRDYQIEGRAWGKDKPGNRERIENLKYAIEHCAGRFRVVIEIAKDVNANPREAQECFPKPQLVMKVTDLNQDTGEFSAISIDDKV
jgi:hypothetical protein